MPIATPTTARNVVAESDHNVGDVAVEVVVAIASLLVVELETGPVTTDFVEAELVADVLAEDAVLDATVPPRPWLGPTTMKIEEELP